MLPLNDDNNDDLFKNAAADYFLAADNPDWEAFIRQLNTEADASGQELTPLSKDKPGKDHWLSRVYGKWLSQKHSLLQTLRFDWWPGKAKKKIEMAVCPVYCPASFSCLLQSL